MIGVPSGEAEEKQSCDLAGAALLGWVCLEQEAAAEAPGPRERLAGVPWSTLPQVQ